MWNETDWTNYYHAMRMVCENSNNNYAKAYAKVGLDLAQHSFAVAQCLYVLSNLAHWRGEQAKATKAVLRDLAKKNRSN